MDYSHHSSIAKLYDIEEIFEFKKMKQQILHVKISKRNSKYFTPTENELLTTNYCLLLIWFLEPAVRNNQIYVSQGLNISYTNPILERF